MDASGNDDGAKAAHAAKVAKKPAPLSFLKKAQVVSGFDMDIELGSTAPASYQGNFILGSILAAPPKKQLDGFFAEEGVTPLPGKGRLRISAKDYYALEAKYHVPLQKNDIEQLVRKFAVPGHKADFVNSNSAFGIHYSRAIKLLRDHGIDATCHLLDNKATAGDQSDRCTITLSDAAYAKLSQDLPEILKAEAIIEAQYKQRLAERSAVTPAAEAS